MNIVIVLIVDFFSLMFCISHEVLRKCSSGYWSEMWVALQSSIVLNKNYIKGTIGNR
jgi:hypothetical protein